MNQLLKFLYRIVTKIQTWQKNLQDVLRESCKKDIDLARIMQDRHRPCKNLARKTMNLQESCKEDLKFARVCGKKSSYKI